MIESLIVMNKKTIKVNNIKYFSEFIGTFILSISLGLLFIVINGNKKIILYFENEILVSLYAIFIMLFLFILFYRWSCDLNPIITLYKIFYKDEKSNFGIYKIICQFMGAFIAGIIIFFITKNPINTAINTSTVTPGIFKLGNLNSLTKIFQMPLTAGFFWGLFVGTFSMMMILWSWFSSAISEKYRYLIICFTFGCAVLVGLVSSDNYIMTNPARVFSQQVPAILNGSINSLNGSILISTIAVLLSGIIAPLFYKFLKSFTHNHLNSALMASVLYKTHIFYHPKKKKNTDNKKDKK